MVHKQALVQLKKLEQREEKWLLGEDSYLNELEQAIKDKDKVSVKRILRLISRYEIRLERYHKRVLDAIKSLGERGLIPEYKDRLDKVERDIKNFQAVLIKYLSRDGSLKDISVSLGFLVDQDKWSELNSSFLRIRRAIKAWILLDRRLLDFENELYESGKKVSDTVFSFIRHHDKPGVLKQLADYIKKYGLWLFDSDLKSLVKDLIGLKVLPSSASKAFYGDEPFLSRRHFVQSLAAAIGAFALGSPAIAGETDLSSFIRSLKNPPFEIVDYNGFQSNKPVLIYCLDSLHGRCTDKIVLACEFLSENFGVDLVGVEGWTGRVSDLQSSKVVPEDFFDMGIVNKHIRTSHPLFQKHLSEITHNIQFPFLNGDPQTIVRLVSLGKFMVVGLESSSKYEMMKKSSTQELFSHIYIQDVAPVQMRLVSFDVDIENSDDEIEKKRLMDQKTRFTEGWILKPGVSGDDLHEAGESLHKEYLAIRSKRDYNSFLKMKKVLFASKKRFCIMVYGAGHLKNFQKYFKQHRQPYVIISP